MMAAPSPQPEQSARASLVRDVAGELSGENVRRLRIPHPPVASWRVRLRECAREARNTAERRAMVGGLLVGGWTGLLIYLIGNANMPSFLYQSTESNYQSKVFLLSQVIVAVFWFGLYKWLMQTYRSEREKAERLLRDSELPLIIADHVYGESIFAYFPKPVIDHGFQRKENLSIEARVKFAARAFPLVVQFWRGIAPDDPDNAKLRLRSNDIPTLAIQHAICNVLLGEEAHSR